MGPESLDVQRLLQGGKAGVRIGSPRKGWKASPARFPGGSQLSDARRSSGVPDAFWRLPVYRLEPVAYPHVHQRFLYRLPILPFTAGNIPSCALPASEIP